MSDALASIAAGRLDQRVYFQRPVHGEDASGAVVQDFVDDFPAWAEVLPLSGREPIVGRRLQGEVTHQVTVRGRADKTVTPDWRIRHGDRRYDIDHIVDESSHGVFLKIRCVEAILSPTAPTEQTFPVGDPASPAPAPAPGGGA